LWFCFIAEETEVAELLSDRAKELGQDLRLLTVRLLNFLLQLNASCDFNRFPEIESWLVKKKNFLSTFGFRSDANFSKPAYYAKLNSLASIVKKPIQNSKLN
jgi:hypothetical protein